MRPLPRVLAFADDRIAALEDLGIRAASVAAVGPAAGLVARIPNGTTDQLASLALRFVSLATPPMASVFVTGRVDVALAVGAQGVILRAADIGVGDARQVARARHPEQSAGSFGSTTIPTILRSVHSRAEAEGAARDGADAIIVGSIWASNSHPGRSASGTGVLRDVVSLGLPVFAIGGVTAERARQARDLGAWGVAAIGAIWDAKDSYRAVMELVADVTPGNLTGAGGIFREPCN